MKKDKTALSFAIEPGFAVKAAYENFKAGQPRVKRWPEIKSQNLATDPRPSPTASRDRRDG
jgi:hypothetical protein